MTHDEEVFRGTMYYRFAMDEILRKTTGLPACWNNQRKFSNEWYEGFHSSEEYKRYFDLYLEDLAETRESWSNEISNAFRAFSNGKESK